jgi:hypothetical protein
LENEYSVNEVPHGGLLVRAKITRASGASTDDVLHLYLVEKAHKSILHPYWFNRFTRTLRKKIDYKFS